MLQGLTSQHLTKLHQVDEELGAVTHDEHQHDHGEGGGDVKVPPASVGHTELVAAPLDLDEGESVEESQQDEGDKVEHHQGHGGRHEAVGLVDPQLCGQDVEGEAAGGVKRHVVLGHLVEAGVVRSHINYMLAMNIYPIDGNFPHAVLKESETRIEYKCDRVAAAPPCDVDQEGDGEEGGGAHPTQPGRRLDRQEKCYEWIQMDSLY